MKNFATTAKVSTLEPCRKKSSINLNVWDWFKAHQAVFVIKDLLGDGSANNSENQCAVLHKLGIAVPCGEDEIVDLRKNNGSKPKSEKFGEVRYFSFYFCFLPGEVAHQK